MVAAIKSLLFLLFAFLWSRANAIVPFRRPQEVPRSFLPPVNILGSGNASSQPLNGSSNSTDVPIKLGIIGAGASGLYAALLLDSLGIDYEILEANTRTGGRIWTHYFDEAKWESSRPGDPEYYDYFDVGAMRIPSTPYMDRLTGSQPYSLLNYINANQLNESDKIATIPFIFRSNNTFLYYNNVLRYISQPQTNDPFHISAALNGTVPPDFTALDPVTVWENVIKDFTVALTTDFDQGFKGLARSDSLSVREYLHEKGFTDAEIDWLETVDDATGHFDMGLSEMVLEDWIFDESPLDSWVAVEGGMSRIVKGMLKLIRGNVLYSQRVTRLEPRRDGTLTVTTDNASYNYDHVINTVPLGAMQVMDMSALNLGYERESAIRLINYDPASKIGIKFKTRWWEALPEPIRGGQSYSDLPIRTCVYPSYGLNTTNASATMIASYTWGQDSSRLASYLSTPSATEHLINITLHDLALLHNVTPSFLQSQYVDSFAWSWYDSEFAVGAFPVFGPSQFAGLMPALMKPAADGRMHFGGDALSAGHAWIVGALNSAYRCVMEVLVQEEDGEKVKELVDKWGTPVEMDVESFNSTEKPVGTS